MMLLLRAQPIDFEWAMLYTPVTKTTITKQLLRELEMCLFGVRFLNPNTGQTDPQVPADQCPTATCISVALHLKCLSQALSPGKSQEGRLPTFPTVRGLYPTHAIPLKDDCLEKMDNGIHLGLSGAPVLGIL